MPNVWAGIDAGKSHHYCVVIDADGTRLLSRKFANTESEILDILAKVCDLADGGMVTWATDLNSGGAALMISILTGHGQALLYIPGRTVHYAARTYRGDGKSDAKDAGIIADQARMRRELLPVRVGGDASTELRLLTARRVDLVCDRTRAINRLRAALLEYFPALEACFDYSAVKASLVLLTRYQTPDSIRRVGHARLTTWLANQGCRSASVIAEKAVEAAKSQTTTVAGQALGAELVAKLATDVLRLRSEIAEIERQIESRLAYHPLAEIILSVPGFGALLSAEFLAATGGNMANYGSADRLAGVAGLAPAPRDSGRISGNNHRPRRYDRRLLRACYLSAHVAASSCPASRTYYDRKRLEGKSHKQAVLCLARRRINVIWALIRDNTTYSLEPALTRIST